MIGCSALIHNNIWMFIQIRSIWMFVWSYRIGKHDNQTGDAQSMVRWRGVALTSRTEIWLRQIHAYPNGSRSKYHFGWDYTMWNIQDPGNPLEGFLPRSALPRTKWPPWASTIFQPIMIFLGWWLAPPWKPSRVTKSQPSSFLLVLVVYAWPQDESFW